MMPTRILKFPDGFLWGAATAAHQVEGGNTNNDWYMFEQKGGCENGEVSGLAVDHYHRYEEDFDIAQSLNHNIHRFSIEWSRIEPCEGKFDPQAIKHYQDVVKALKKRGMKVILTLFHFTVPLWFAKKGGFEKSKNIKYFERFVEYVASNLDAKVDYWVSINEPNIYAFQNYLYGIFPAQKKSLLLFLCVYKNLISAHKKAYKTLHKILENPRVGYSHNLIYCEPQSRQSFFDKMLFFVIDFLHHRWFLEGCKKYLDFLGVQYYFHNILSFSFLRQFFRMLRRRKKDFIKEAEGFFDKEVLKSDLGWEIYPQGVYYVLKQAGRYDIPIIITENGVADATDKIRQQFIHNHIKAAHQALEEGVDLRGYLHWTLTDNFEWNFGRSARFGLVEIDYEDNLKRKIRTSARYFAKICQENQLEIETSSG